MESASLEIPVKGHFFFLKNVLNSYFQNKMVGYAKPFRSKGFTLNTIPAFFNWGSNLDLRKTISFKRFRFKYQSSFF